jgi:hypothetical protein
MWLYTYFLYCLHLGMSASPPRSSCWVSRGNSPDPPGWSRRSSTYSCPPNNTSLHRCMSRPALLWWLVLLCLLGIWSPGAHTCWTTRGSSWLGFEFLASFSAQNRWLSDVRKIWSSNAPASSASCRASVFPPYPTTVLSIHHHNQYNNI